MAKPDEKIEARKKRRRGMSINAIARSLAVSKGTVSVWCRDIELTEKQKEYLARETGPQVLARLKGAHMQRDRRLRRISDFEEEARGIIGNLNDRDILIALGALYWGEGNKTNRQFILSNADPDMIVVLMGWLSGLGVSDERFAPCIFINEIHRNRISTVQEFWEKKTGIPRAQFRRTTFVKTKLKKRYENHDEHYGTLRISVLRSSDLFYKVMGAVHHLSLGSSVG